MNYIINPWVFYLLNLFGNIEALCWTLIITGLVVYGVYILVWLMADLYDSGNYPSPLAILKKWKIPVMLCIVVLILTPYKRLATKCLSLLR